MARLASRVSLAAAFVCLYAGLAVAQAQGQTTRATATETRAFEVMAVNADSLVLQLPEGPREMAISDSTTFMVNGQPMAVRELQPGMKGMATITTTTYITPVTTTEVKNGRVVMAGAGRIVIRTTDGDTKAFSQEEIDRRGVKVLRDGKPALISDFRTGDTLSATVLVGSAPRVVHEQELRATLDSPAPTAQTAEVLPPDAPPPDAAPPDAAAPIESRPPERVTASNGTSARDAVGTSGQSDATPGAVGTSGRDDTLPTTAGDAPAIALAGITALAAAAMLSIRRRSREL